MPSEADDHSDDRRVEPQPQSRPCSAMISNGTRPTISARAPGQSIRWSRRVCGRCRLRMTSTRATVPIGTLIRKTQRQPVDAEDGLLAGEEAADDRAEHARGAEDGEEVALVLGALPRRHDVADDRQREREQAAGAEALDGAEGGELPHRLGEAAQHRADDEDGDRGDEERPAAVEVGQLAVERRADRGGDEVGGRRPRLDRQAVQVVGDGADRGRDDGLVERGQEHAGHQAGQDREDLPVGQRLGVGRGSGGRAHEAECSSRVSVLRVGRAAGAISSSRAERAAEEVVVEAVEQGGEGGRPRRTSRRDAVEHPVPAGACGRRAARGRARWRPAGWPGRRRGRGPARPARP